jgi:hypothetical protein
MASVPEVRPRAITSTALVVLAALLLGALVAVLGTRVPAGAEPPVAETAEPERPYAPGIDPALVADATIRGTALGPDGRLRDHVLVEAFSALDPTGEPVASDLTYEVGDVASHGAYTLHVPAGEYLVRFSSPDDARVVLEPTYHGGGAGTPVAVSPTQDLLLDPVTLRRDRGVPVTGRVVDATGEPRGGIEVWLTRVHADGDISLSDYAWTSSDGSFRLEGAGRGRTFTVGVYGGEDASGTELGLPNTWLGGTPSWYTADTFVVGHRSTGHDVGDVVHRAGVEVSGRVTSPTGPVGPADVALFHLDGRGGAALVAWDWVGDEDDTFAFSALPGQYTIGVTTWDGGGEAADFVYLGDTRDLDAAETFTVGSAPVALPPVTVVNDSAALTVRVIDRDGAPANPWYHSVALVGPDGDVLGWADSVGDGVFTARVRWGTTFTVGVAYEEDEGWIYLGDTSSFDQARFLTAASPATALDAGVLSLALPAPTAPVPVLGGRARIGQVLGVSAPTWSVPGVVSSYQWLLDGNPLWGETSSAYLVRTADAGHRVSVRITGRLPVRAAGVVTSDGLLVGLGDAPTALRPPTITGQAALGGTLTATPGAWDTAGVTTTLRWYADGEPIYTSVGRTWRVRPDGVGKQITVVETAVRDGHATGSSTSLPVRVDRSDPELRVSLRKGDLRAQVKAPGMQTERGRLMLLDGRRVVRSVDLNSTHHGVVVFDLARLRPGVHRLSVRYSGSAVSKADQSNAVTVRVP